MLLEVLPGRYAICRLAPEAVQPVWARSPAGAGLLSVTWSDSGLSVVCPEDRVPAGVPVERDLVALRVGDTLQTEPTGVLTALTTPLSDEGVLVYAISTHEAGFLLLPAPDLDRGRAALAFAGHLVEIPGEEASDFGSLFDMAPEPIVALNGSVPGGALVAGNVRHPTGGVRGT